MDDPPLFFPLQFQLNCLLFRLLFLHETQTTLTTFHCCLKTKQKINKNEAKALRHAVVECNTYKRD